MMEDLANDTFKFEEDLLPIRANKKVNLFNDIASIAALCTGPVIKKEQLRTGSSFYNKL